MVKKRDDENEDEKRGVSRTFGKGKDIHCSPSYYIAGTRKVSLFLFQT